MHVISIRMVFASVLAAIEESQGDSGQVCLFGVTEPSGLWDSTCCVVTCGSGHEHAWWVTDPMSSPRHPVMFGSLCTLDGCGRDWAG